VEADKPNDQAMEAEREAVPGGEARWTLHVKKTILCETKEKMTL
jgi:hypothetical protein